jgi:hypothetical protein
MIIVLNGCLLTLACNRAPEQTVRLQGTVTSIGYGLPVSSAEVIVEWPATLKGGTSTLKTDGQGHYAVGRTVRTKTIDCKGMVITVRAPGFASAYNQSTEDCPDGTLTADFKLFPIPK